MHRLARTTVVFSPQRMRASAQLKPIEIGADEPRCHPGAHCVGLATKPQILTAKQVRAQAVYDLENARSMVHDAETGLRQAIGLAPNSPVNIRAGELEHLPETLRNDIEVLMSDALKQRPDIAAQVAEVRAGDAAIARARAEYYPEVEIGGNYGQVIWSYTVNGGPTQNLNQPFCGALLTLRWNLFTGFERYYGVQKAIADRNAAREQLKPLELDAVTPAWTAYYDFHSAQKKYEASQALVAASQEAYDATSTAIVTGWLPSPIWSTPSAT